MLDFIVAYWDSILVVVAFIAVVVFLAVRGKKQIIYKMLFALVKEAEEQYGAKTGQLKFAEVMTNIYALLPAVFRVFITYDTLEGWIEKAVVEVKEYLQKQAENAE